MNATQMPSFTALFLILFTFSILRALPNIEHMAIKDKVVPTEMGFVLSDYIKPLIFFMSFVLMSCRFVMHFTHLSASKRKDIVVLIAR
jgi:hypothetical protein